MAEAEKQGAQLIADARRTAEAEKARILAEAKAEADQEVQRARDALRDQVAALAVKWCGADPQGRDRSGTPCGPAERTEGAALGHGRTLHHRPSVRRGAVSGSRPKTGVPMRSTSGRDLVSRLGAVASDPDMARLMSDPRVTGDQIYSVFAGAVAGRRRKRTRHACAELRAHADRQRPAWARCPRSACSSRSSSTPRQGSAEAHITSAFAMNDSEVTDLVDRAREEVCGQAEAGRRGRCRT